MDNLEQELKNELVIHTGVEFMRAITDAYGTESGHKLWNTIMEAVDPEIKDGVFLAVLTGQFSTLIKISAVDQYSNDKLATIKAIRNFSKERFGLKDAKEMADRLWAGTPISFRLNDIDNRRECIDALRAAGCKI